MRRSRADVHASARPWLLWTDFVTFASPAITLHGRYPSKCPEGCIQDSGGVRPRCARPLPVGAPGVPDRKPGVWRRRPASGMRPRTFIGPSAHSLTCHLLFLSSAGTSNSPPSSPRRQRKTPTTAPSRMDPTRLEAIPRVPSLPLARRSRKLTTLGGRTPSVRSSS